MFRSSIVDREPKDDPHGSLFSAAADILGVVLLAVGVGMLHSPLVLLAIGPLCLGFLILTRGLNEPDDETEEEGATTSEDHNCG